MQIERLSGHNEMCGQNEMNLHAYATWTLSCRELLVERFKLQVRL